MGRVVTALLIPLLLLVLSIPLVLALLRANEIAFLRIRAGNVALVRGRIPPPLLADLRDICKTPAASGSLRIVVEDRRARVYAEGELTSAQKQQVKNVLGAWPVARLRNGARA